MTIETDTKPNPESYLDGFIAGFKGEHGGGQSCDDAYRQGHLDGEMARRRQRWKSGIRVVDQSSLQAIGRG
jgi:hypothetical protein